MAADLAVAGAGVQEGGDVVKKPVPYSESQPKLLLPSSRACLTYGIDAP